MLDSTTKWKVCKQMAGMLTNYAKVLVELDAKNGHVTQRQLALLCNLTERTVTAFIAKAKKEGLILSFSDTRPLKYELSPEGDEFIKRARLALGHDHPNK